VSSIPLDRPGGSWRLLLLAAAAFVAHVAAVLYVLPPALVADGRPIVFADYALHLRSCLLYQRLPAGQVWAYDPFQMAGYPANTIEATSNHATEVFVAAFGGSRPVVAFKVFVLLTFLLLPVAVGLAVRALGSGWGEAVGAGWLASLVWAIDPHFRLFREFGGFSFPFASALCLLALALLYRFLASGRWPAAAGFAAASCAAAWVHVLSLPMLALGGLAALAARPAGWQWRRATTAGALLLLPPVSILVWLRPLVENLRWVADTAHRLDSLGGRDLVALLAFAPGARFQSGIVWLGIAGLVVLARSRRSLAVCLGLTAVPLLLAAFLPLAEALGLRQLQVQRFLLTALLWLLPAGAAAVAWALGRLSAWPRRIVVVVVAAVATAYQQLPWLQVLAGSPTRMASLADRAALPAHVERLGQWIAARPPAGQVVLEDVDHIDVSAYGGSPVGGLLALLQSRPLLGGPEEVPLRQQAVDLTYGRWLGRPLVTLGSEELRSLLDRYAVAWIVAVRPDTVQYLLAQPGVVVPGERWGPFSTFGVRAPAPFADGADSVSLALGRIAVHGATVPQTLVRLHWHQRVRCTPPLAVERVVFPEDPVGLMRVRNGAMTDFVLTFDAPSPAL
jgi:hypothetical protein